MRMLVPGILTALCCSMLASCVPSLNSHFALNRLRPDSLELRSIDIEAYKKKYAGKDGVYIESNDVVDHVIVGEVWQAYRFSTLRFIILNKDAQWLTTFTVRVNPGEELYNAYINITSPNGSVTSYTKADMKIEKDSDGKTVYRFAYPDVQVGTIVDEGYGIRYVSGLSLLQYEFPLQFDVPCERISASFAYPKNLRVRIKSIRPHEPLGYKYNYDIKNTDVVEYKATDVPAIADEPFSPYLKEMANYLRVAVTHINGVAMIDSWHDYADDFKVFAIDRESLWRDRPGDVIDDIVADGMSDYDKLDTIVSWLQQNVEVDWTSYGFNFNDVIKKKKGNPYLITGLGRLMLEKAGIDATFVLIHSAEDGYFDEDYVVAGSLTTPALLTLIDEKQYVVFPYIKNLPVDHIPEYVQGQAALRINSDGHDGFAKLPLGNPSQNTVVENYQLSIDEDGNITVTEEKEFRGSAALRIRGILKDAREEEMGKIMKDLLTYEEGDVKLTSYKVDGREIYKKPLVIRLEYTIDNLVTVTPDEVIFQTGGLLSPSSNQSTKVDTEDRKNPIRIYYDERFIKNIVIHYPESWQLASEFGDVGYENQFGDIKATYTKGIGEFRIEQQRTLNHCNEPATRFDELLKIIGRRSRVHVPTLIFEVDE